jgi:large subunit ribosomal protein L24
MVNKIRKGDKVVVLAGKDKGRNGEVIRVMPTLGVAIVSGINMVLRHQKQSQKQSAGLISKEAPINLSNIGIPDPKDGKPTRVGFVLKDGKKFRIAKRSGVMIDE